MMPGLGHVLQLGCNTYELAVQQMCPAHCLQQCVYQPRFASFHLQPVHQPQDCLQGY